MNPDYMLAIENARLAAKEIQDHFIPIEIVKENMLVQAMITITSEQYDAEPELIKKELWK